jgi:hypothetical protein
MTLVHRGAGDRRAADTDPVLTRPPDQAEIAGGARGAVGLAGAVSQRPSLVRPQARDRRDETAPENTERRAARHRRCQRPREVVESSIASI